MFCNLGMVIFLSWLFLYDSKVDEDVMGVTPLPMTHHPHEALNNKTFLEI